MMDHKEDALVYLFGFYGIKTSIGYLMQNPFLYKWTALIQTI